MEKDKKITSIIDDELLLIAEDLKNKYGNANILVIDDDVWVHKILKNCFQNNGFSVDSAYNPVDGIVFALRSKPMLILLDIIMPDIEGNIMLRLFKSIDETKDIPVIILSGHLSKDNLADLYKHGADGFITKPFEKEIVLEKLKIVINKKVMNKKENDLNLPEQKSMRFEL